MSVFKRPHRDDPDEVRTWTTRGGDTDIRSDVEIGAEVASWLHGHRVKETASHHVIIGCPHQEGIDYPMGRDCPQCPFWSGIDRFTHEPIAIPEPTLSPQEIIDALSGVQRVQPREALASADGHRGELIDALLQALERGVSDWRDLSEEDAQLFAYALYLSAKWREPRAYPLVIRWLSLPDDGASVLAGDVVTQDGGRILAAVCDGDLDPIKRLVLNRDADEFCRAMGVTALALLAAWLEVPRAAIVEYFLWLAREGLERESNQVWGTLAAESADIEALEVFPALRQAYDEGLIDHGFVEASELDDVERSPRGRVLERTRESRPPIDDVAEATRWWAVFDRYARAEQLARASQDAVASGRGARVETHRAPPKVGRNEPCPCGSGKKYKKCCGA